MNRFIAVVWTLVLIMTMPGCNDKSREFAPGDDILDIAKGYKDGGGWNWNGTGVPESIWFKNRPILRKDSRGTYCCGYTFAVFFQAAEGRGLLDGLNAHDLHVIQQHWYGAATDYEEQQAAKAIPDAGLGRIINPADAQPGDFVCFHRRKSGHSVIFLGWVYEGDIIVGMRYRSSQTTTNGIGDATEYFTTSGLRSATIDPKRCYIARLYAG